MSEVDRNRDAQRELYGEPLAAVFARVTGSLALSQAELARVLGMSPPMLSQLGSGKRVKIGNPSVLHRLAEVQALAEEVDQGRVDHGVVESRLDQIRGSTGQWSRTDLSGARSASGAAATAGGPGAGASGEAEIVYVLRGLLRAVASGRELDSAAAVLQPEHPGLAELLRVYGLGTAAEAEAHLARNREFL